MPSLTLKPLGEDQAQFPWSVFLWYDSNWAGMYSWRANMARIADSFSNRPLTIALVILEPLKATQIL